VIDLVVRADATAETGAGHVMRCANLLAAWDRLSFGNSYLFGQVDIPFVSARLSRLGVRRVNALPGDGLRVVVVDSYARAIRESLSERSLTDVFPVLVDDLGGHVETHYRAVWNPNVYSSSALYPDFVGPVIGGVEHVPIRDDLPTWYPDRSSGWGITLGGGLLPGWTTCLLDELEALSQNASPIAAGIVRHPGFTQASESDPWDDLSRCEALVTAAGSSLWEAAAVGIPVLVICLADNQELIAAWAAAAGAPVYDTRTDHGRGVASFVRQHAPGVRALPRVTPGSMRVARALHSLAAESQ
jgi:hypothetical protein